VLAVRSFLLTPHARVFIWISGALQKIGKKGVVGKDCTQIVSSWLDKFSLTLYIVLVLFHHVFDSSVRGAFRLDTSRRNG